MRMGNILKHEKHIESRIFEGCQKWYSDFAIRNNLNFILEQHLFYEKHLPGFNKISGLSFFALQIRNK